MSECDGINISKYTMSIDGESFSYYCPYSGGALAYFTLWKGEDYYLTYSFAGDVSPNDIDNVTNSYLITFSSYDDAYSFLKYGESTSKLIQYGSFSYSDYGFSKILGCNMTTYNLLPPDSYTESTTVLDSIVNPDILSNVLYEILELLPVIVPVVVAFVAIRKGILFVKGAIHSA